jgi:hypothetical protein
MQTKNFAPTAIKFAKLQDFAVIVATCGDNEISKALLSLQCDPAFNGVAWRRSFAKLANIFATKKPLYKIFAKGNSKLPFYSYSVLPAVTCPGAGECLLYCYSFTAWCYPDAFARQVQNTYLQRFNSIALSQAFLALPENVTLRLYVDGDFDSSDTFDFWNQLLQFRSDIKAYGYSKSFKQILHSNSVANNTLAPNYVLNISGGHNSENATVERIKALPITRGEFIAVNVGHKVKSSEHGTVANAKAIRDNVTCKVFPCPGKCGTCTGKGHACGLQSLKGVTIAIAMH